MEGLQGYIAHLEPLLTTGLVTLLEEGHGAIYSSGIPRWPAARSRLRVAVSRGIAPRCRSQRRS